MIDFTVHTHETAPENSKSVLQNVEKAYGFLPNLIAIFAESPAAAEAYPALSGFFDKSGFTPTERQIVLMTNNRLNNCTYCMAAHTTISKMQSVPDDVLQALRDGTALADPKLEALRVFSIKMNENRGFVEKADLDAFLAAGYTKANVLEVVLGMALKVMSNYTNHVANTPLDDAFKAAEWSAETSDVV